MKKIETPRLESSPTTIETRYLSNTVHGVGLCTHKHTHTHTHT